MRAVELPHPSRSGPRAFGRTLAGSLLIAGTAISCKPSALFNLNENDFDSVQVTSAMSDPGLCASNTSSTAHSLRLTLLDQQDEVILPDVEQLVGYVLTPNVTWTASDVEFEQLGQRIFPVPDVPCAADAQEGSLCPIAVYADANFRCEAPGAGSADQSARLVCASAAVNANINTNQAILYSEAPEVDVVILSATGSTIFGEDPCGVNDQSWGSVGRGNDLNTAYIDVVSALSESAYASDIEVCVGGYRGEGTLNLLNEGAGGLDCFSRVDRQSDVETFRERLTRLQVLEPNRGTRNYLAAIDETIRLYPTFARGERELHIIVFADGPLDPADITANQASGRTATSVADAATAIGATLHILQLDNQPPNAPAAVQSITGQGIPSGAVDELEALACLTGGEHFYVEDTDSLPGLLANTARRVPHFYELGMNVTGLNQLPIGAYKLEASLEVRVNSVTETFAFRQDGLVENDTTDTRLALFNRGTCDPAATGGNVACQPGRVCSAGVCVRDYTTLPDVYPAPTFSEELQREYDECAN
ncbi:MAG: hypothetical protein ACI82G_001148 [Bradymonadia bacterium]|jgi:hypothetical protein